MIPSFSAGGDCLKNNYFFDIVTNQTNKKDASQKDFYFQFFY